MNFPGALITGANDFVSDEEAQRVRAAIQNEERIMASLDAEIRQAKATLANLVQRRSEVRNLLVSNTAPSEAEILAIRETILQQEATLSRISGEIDETRCALRELARERGCAEASQMAIDAPEAGLNETIDLERINAEAHRREEDLERLVREYNKTRDSVESHKAILSPVRRIPPEILGEIFHHCLCFSYKDFVRPSAEDAPLLLLQVCKSWKKIAESTPRLWSSIAVHITAHACSPNTALIDNWLSRSGQCPLSFSISESCLDSLREEGVPNSALILYMFIPYLHRWQSVRLECIDWRTNSGLSHLPDSPAPLLESIYLQRSFWLGTDKEPLSRMMESSPRLHDVSWTSIEPSLPSFPWSQLTDIFLGCSISVDACLDLLLQSPQLVHCQVTVEVVLQHPSQTTSVVLPHLESLDFSTNGDIGPLLPCLTLPSLKGFTLIHQQLLHNVPERAHWPHTQFMSLLSRSGCALTTLNLHDTVIQPSDLIDCLSKISPSLLNLNLSNDWLKHSSVTEELLNLMIYRTPYENGIPNYLCPYLREIKFWESISPSRSTLVALADMIESRWDPDFDVITGGRPPHVALKRTIKFCLIVLRSEPPPDEQVFARLSALSGRRLGLSIIHH